MLTHGNLLSNAEVLVDLWRFTDADVLLHALPIFHTHGLFVASNVALLSGAAMIFLPGFEVEAVLRLVAPGHRDDGGADVLYAAAGRGAV